jgi:hypothetical protein
MNTRWEDDWMHSNFVPEYVALSRFFVNDELKALVRFHGTRQRHFYTSNVFEKGDAVEVPGQFATLQEAKDAAMIPAHRTIRMFTR